MGYELSSQDLLYGLLKALMMMTLHTQCFDKYWSHIPSRRLVPFYRGGNWGTEDAFQGHCSIWHHKPESRPSAVSSRLLKLAFHINIDFKEGQEKFFEF